MMGNLETNKKIKGYRRLIPSMTAMMEFEAVARLSSFTLAAQELGVSQAAVRLKQPEQAQIEIDDLTQRVFLAHR